MIERSSTQIPKTASHAFYCALLFSCMLPSSLPASSISQALQRLADMPRLALGHLPTPLQALHRISAHVGGPRIWIKRDDCTGLATGGNKTRKLEFLLGDALAQGCDTLISQGALQSNHARQVAAAGAAAGLKVHLVLSDAVPDRQPDYARLGNIQLCRLLGAQVQIVPGDSDSDALCAQLARDLAANGAKPYVIPMGGSNGMGALGYASALIEIANQMHALGEPLDAVVLATGSGGTQAGLMLGAALMQWSGQVYGVSVSPDYALAAQRVGKALDEASALLDLPTEVARSVPLLVDEAFKGPHYGIPNTATYAALELAARMEGVLLDPVYSGKGFAGLLAACAAGGGLHNARNVVFLHTGGTAALSAYPEVGNTTLQA